jgi:hypothetical protein
MQNLNEYNEEKFKNEFENTDLCRQIKKDFDRISWYKNHNAEEDSRLYTSRQQLGQSLFSLVPFYYLQKLTEKNPSTIYDLGCGWNIFKKYIPNVIGLDNSGGRIPKTPGINFFADVDEVITYKYIAKHQNYFESAFSINSFHYQSLSKLESTITKFVSMIKPNGRGFMALNLMTIIKFTSSEELLELFSTDAPTNIDYENYIRSVLSKIDCQYLIVDVDLTNMNEPLNGNIRIVFEKR